MRMTESLYIQYVWVLKYKLGVCMCRLHELCVAVNETLRSDAPWCPLLRLAPALPPYSASPSATSSSSTVLVLCSLLFLLIWCHHEVPAMTLVAWWTVSQGLAMRAQVSGVNEGHHILVPGLGSCALIGGTRQGGQDAIGGRAPDSNTDGDGGPVIAVLLHLTVVDAAVGELGAPNQDTPLYHHQLVTCHYLV